MEADHLAAELAGPGTRVREAMHEYVAYRYRYPKTTLTEQLKTQYELAHNFMLEEKHYFSVMVNEFERHERNKEGEVNRH